MINLPSNTIDTTSENAVCAEKGIEMWAQVREISKILRQIGHIYLSTSLWELISLHAKGPPLQPPYPIMPLERLRAKNTQLPGEIQNLISYCKSRGHDFFGAGKYHCGPAPLPWEIPESFGWLRDGLPVQILQVYGHSRDRVNTDWPSTETHQSPTCHVQCVRHLRF